MSDFEYSVDALNTKSIFYGAKVTVYVEGEDDILFWDAIFSATPNLKFHIEPLGGSNELDEYIEKIKSQGLVAIVARDSDYLDHTNKKITHDRILYTYGYSIENSLFTAESVHALTKLWCKDVNLDIAVCTQWLESFASDIRSLLRLDIANSMKGTGLQVLRDNCSQFMQSKTSPHLCPGMIDYKVKEVQDTFSSDLVATVDQRIGNSATDVCTKIRGHFLASAVSRFISKHATKLGRKVSLSNDALYATAIAQFGNHLTASHAHHRHYIQAASRAAAAC